jgi:class III poly(R)-hydroxyalkanoic acid synthase PhaC subunit
LNLLTLSLYASKTLWDSCLSLADFYARLANIFAGVYLTNANFISKYKNFSSLKEAERIWLSTCRDTFEESFREGPFIQSLSKSIDCYSKLAQTNGIGQWYQSLSNITSIWNNLFIEPIRDALWRTPSHEIYSEGKFSLYHYKSEPERMNSKAPILIIYAFINRHYILDLLPEVSLVNSLLGKGLDVFATDWGTPSAYDQDLTLEYYLNNYLDKSMDKIREHTGTDKVSLFGYCWGGNLALMYAALYPEKVKNLITLSTPVDFSLDDGLLSLWTKKLKVHSLIDTFGNVPSIMLNAAFALRSPIDYVHKYPHFFEEPRDIQSIVEFIATEMWLYDSPPVIGEIYRQFVNDCYQNNLLVKNMMKIGNKHTINLKNIIVPSLNILAKRDDLVAPDSSRAIGHAIGSKDKTTLEFDSGHVGTITSLRAHKELWPKVGDWIADHS